MSLFHFFSSRFRRTASLTLSFAARALASLRHSAASSRLARSLARTVLVFLSRPVTVDLPILPLAGASISSLYRGAFALVVMSHLHLAPQDDMAAAAADDGRLPGAGRPFRHCSPRPGRRR